MAGQQSRQYRQQSATANSAGVVSFEYQPAPMGYTYTGTLAIVASPASVVWTVYAGGSQVGNAQSGNPLITTLGATPIYDLQQPDNEVFVVQCAEGSFTEGDEIVCSFVCILDATSGTDLTVPKTGGQNVDISGSGTIDVDITAGTVEVENVEGTFLLTGDTAAISAACTPATGSYAGPWTTTTVPPGYKGLVIPPPSTNGGFDQWHCNVVGKTSGFYYAFAEPCSQFFPTVVTIDPGMDDEYVITFPGSSYGTSDAPAAYFMSQPPDFGLGNVQLNSLNVVTPGASQVSTLSTPNDTHNYLLSEITIRVTPIAGTTGVNLVTIDLYDIFGNDTTTELNTTGAGIASTTFDFPDKGLMLPPNDSLFLQLSTAAGSGTFARWAVFVVYYQR